MTWSLSAYSSTPGSNTLVNGINIAEGCNASGINDAIRQVMADIASGMSSGLLIGTGGNAATATKLETARSFSLTGNLSATGVFDGSADLSLSTTITSLPAISGANLTTLNASNLTSGTVADARIPSSVIRGANNLSDVANATTARTNLGLGTAAVKNIGSSGATVPLLSTGNSWSGQQTIAVAGACYWGLQDTTGNSSWRLNAAGDTFYLARTLSGVTDFPFSISAAGVVSFNKPPTITAGPLDPAYGGTGVASISALKTALGYGTAANYNTSTSGVNVPLLSGQNTWGNSQTLAAAQPSWTWNDTGSASTTTLDNLADKWRFLRRDKTTLTYTTPLSISLTTDVATFLNPPLFTNGPLAANQGGTGVTSIAALKTALGYGTAATLASSDVAQTANNLSDLASPSAARTNLGLGTAAVQSMGTSGATLGLLNGNNTFSGANTFSKQVNGPEAAVTDGASIAWDLSTQQAAHVTLAGNRTLANPTNMVAGGSYVIKITQDGTGSRTLAYGTAYKWPGGNAPVLSTAPNAVDIITFYSDGTSMFGAAQKAFS